MRAVLFTAVSVLLPCLQIAGATFGSVVVIGGHASDLALDGQRGRLYIANFAGRRIDVMSTFGNTLGTPISMATQGESGSLALSPDNRYLVVTNYDNCVQCDFLQGSAIPTLTVIDLAANSQQTCLVPPQPLPPATLPAVIPCPQPPPPPPTVATPNIPYTIAFGGGNKAFVVTTNTAFLFDPATLTFTTVPYPLTLSSVSLPVPFATFPPQIIQASDGVSGDGQTIYVLAQVTQGIPATLTTPAIPGNELILRYNVASSTLSIDPFVTVPPMGPRVVSVNTDGSRFTGGWALLEPSFNPNGAYTNILLAEFPYPTGALNLGSNAFDSSRNLIYAQLPSAGPAAPPVLHVVDSDNLTVRERIQLPENLAGRSIFSSDMNTLYAISDNGVTVLPIGSFTTAHRVSTQEEQLLFLSGGCNGTIQQTLHVVDLGGGNTDFAFSLPAGTQGIRFSQVSGTTPATVTIQIDPSAFLGQTGTTVVPLSIQSAGSIGIPNQVRLLINTKDPDQRGIIHSLPGTIVDLAADPFRPRIYALRQDRNQVIVMDGTSFNILATLRTGNTPTKMAFTRDSKYMIVGNDHSQIASVFDLDALQPTPFIVFPRGHYPRSVAASGSTILAISRNSLTPQFGAPVPVTGPNVDCLHGPAGPAEIDQIDFGNRIARVACSLGVYLNSPAVDSVMTASPSGASIFTAMADGTVLLYNDAFQAFQASRKDLTALGGSYSALTDNVFLAGGILFDNSMVQLGPVPTATLTSSVLISGTSALTINAATPSSPGAVNIVSLSSTTVQPVRSIEAPVTKAILSTPPIGQIGQTILSFLQTIATATNGSTLYLSISGFTELPANFNQPAAMPAISSVVNSADGGLVSPGSLVTIWGSGLSTASATASSLPLPNALAEVCVTANNVALPLIHVSSNRIDAQLPFEVSGSANLAVAGPGGASVPFRVTAPATALAVFQNGQGAPSQPVIYRASNNALVDVTNPIHSGDTLVILATGLGQTAPAAVSGAGASADPLESSLAVPSISLGGTPLQVTFSGLLPGMVGVYQINATVPDGVPVGPQIPLVVQQASSASTFMMSVVNR